MHGQHRPERALASSDPLQTTRLYHSAHQFIKSILQLIRLLDLVTGTEISVQNCCAEQRPDLLLCRGFILHPHTTAAGTLPLSYRENAPCHGVIVQTARSCDVYFVTVKSASRLISFPVKSHILECLYSLELLKVVIDGINTC